MAAKSKIRAPRTPVAPKTVLKSDEVCAILKACGENGVRVLKFADLYVQFGPKPAPARQSSEISPTDVRATENPPSPDTEMSETATKIDQTTLDQLELQAKQDRLERMMLEDPAEYERLMASGDLTDAPASSDDE